MDDTIKILLLLSLCIITYSIWGLTSAIIKFIKEKTKKLSTPNTEEKPDKLDFIEKIEASSSLMNFINVMINVEVTRMIQALQKLRTKYDVSNLDKDARNIAETVFNGMNKTIVFSESFDNMILSKEYVMQYISSQSIIVLMNAAFEYNKEYAFISQT